MSDVKFKLDETGAGHFYIMQDDEQVGEMQIGIKDKIMTVYHTEVSAKVEGKGYARRLLSAMVDYARNQGLKVSVLCPYVGLQFKRHSEDYADIWLRLS